MFRAAVINLVLGVAIAEESLFEGFVREGFVWLGEAVHPSIWGVVDHILSLALLLYRG